MQTSFLCRGLLRFAVQNLSAQAREAYKSFARAAPMSKTTGTKMADLAACRPCVEMNCPGLGGLDPKQSDPNPA
jgi:hypothetical protein